MSPRPGETTADIPAVRLAHEPITTLSVLIHDAIEILKTDPSATEELREALVRIEQVFPRQLPETTSQFRTGLRLAVEHLATAINLKRATRAQPVYFCLLHVLPAVVIMTDYISSGLEDSNPDVFFRSLHYLVKFGAALDAIASQIGTLSNGLARSAFYLVDERALSAGLLLGLLPINRRVGQARGARQFHL